MRKNTRSSFNYRIDGRFLFIEDLNGNMSVTNDVENVLESISDELNTSLDNYSVLYRDSTGTIDGINTEEGRFSSFYFIGATDFYQAKLKV